MLHIENDAVCLFVGIFTCHRYSEVWLAYASMERHLRHLPEARAVYRRAVTKKMEDQGQYVAALEWLKFEREEGR